MHFYRGTWKWDTINLKKYPLTLNFGLLAVGRLTERWMANSFTYSDDQNLLLLNYLVC